MAKIIKLTPSIIDELKQSFEKALSGAKLLDGKFSFQKSYGEIKDRKAKVWFTPIAYLKMLSLLRAFDSEVAWHGVAKRLNEDNSEYIISDILVYPQEVTGVTVDTDQDAYTAWLMGQDDDTYNSIRIQGHSHVNMGTAPSATDLLHQEKLLSQIASDDFYIFMIWNKSLNRTIKIYDLKKNILFESEDITVDIKCEDNLTEFVENAKKSVKKKTYQSYTSYGQASLSGSYAYGSYGGTKTPSQPAKKEDQSNPFRIKDVKKSEKRKGKRR